MQPAQPKISSLSTTTVVVSEDTRASAAASATSEGAFVGSTQSLLPRSTSETGSNGNAICAVLTGIGFGVSTAALLHELVFNPSVTNAPDQALHIKNEVLRVLSSVGGGALMGAISGLVTYCCTKAKVPTPEVLPINAGTPSDSDAGLVQQYGGVIHSS